jgi:hypothetical protein
MPCVRRKVQPIDRNLLVPEEPLWTGLDSDLLFQKGLKTREVAIMNPIVIVGAVAAGMSAASVIKREHPDREVMVFGKEAYISYGA